MLFQMFLARNPCFLDLTSSFNMMEEHESTGGKKVNDINTHQKNATEHLDGGGSKNSKKEQKNLKM